VSPARAPRAAASGGYITDLPYLRDFHPELAPAWLDFTATLSGIAPPERHDGFSWCELGCGQGVTTVILAATHPRGRFVGIDLMPGHIDHARRLAGEAGISNVRFYAASFADEALNLPAFDYIAAHGVYSWIDEAGQAALHRFIDRRLRPGGLVYLSYNSMPGWTTELPFQRLLLTLARDLPGDSAARLAAAATLMRPLVAVGAPSLTASRGAANLDALEANHPIAYLVHEYLPENWQPLYVTEVRQAMGAIGLVPAGSATVADNFDDFVLRRVERQALEVFDEPDLRELVRDFLMHKQFRRDVFSRAGNTLGDDAQRARLLATRYALTKPVEAVEFTAEMRGAGTLSFDNKTTRKIVTTLAKGPHRLDRIPGNTSDLLANALALGAGRVIRPVEAVDTPVAELNRTIRSRLDGDEQIATLALCCGTALRIDAAISRALRDGVSDNDTTKTWAGYAAIHANG
jgi:SAM-dependent methyltransferase